MAAYVITFDRAMKLETEWRQDLAHWHIQNGFHATDFVARQEEFKNDWTNDERREFIVRLTSIAVDNMTTVIGCALHEEDYLRLDVPDEWRLHLKDHHGFCLFTVLGMLIVAEEARREGLTRLAMPSELELLFDDKPEFRGTANRIFEGRRAIYGKEKVLKGLHFKSETDMPALQAADLLAYFMTREYAEELRGVEHWFPAVTDIIHGRMGRGNRTGLIKPSTERLAEFVDFARRLNPIGADT